MVVRMQMFLQTLSGGMRRPLRSCLLYLLAGRRDCLGLEIPLSKPWYKHRALGTAFVTKIVCHLKKSLSEITKKFKGKYAFILQYMWYQLHCHIM